jgi:NitT/TauT family transport system permease protein
LDTPTISAEDTTLPGAQNVNLTTIETVVSFGLATLLGVALAVAITFSARVREALYPSIVMFQLIPKIALAPLFIVWLGVGSKSCIVVGRSLTASEWQMFRLARFPYAMPFVFAGMKVGVTVAMIGVIVGEFITAQAGLGYIIMFASSAGETVTVLAAIVLPLRHRSRPVWHRRAW